MFVYDKNRLACGASRPSGFGAGGEVTLGTIRLQLWVAHVRQPCAASTW
ncbi:hypothetical protein D558_3395 [Bordetella holmesii 44057]|nr:hypothetical protein D558_3395 [Bordetella holmesii 44057]